MKTILLILTMTFSAFSQVQTVEKPQSNIEKFSAKSGTLIEKKFDDIGTVKSVKVQILTLTDLIGGSKVAGVRFEYETADRYSTDSKTAFIDSDELDGLIASIKTLKQQVFPTTKTGYTEVVYVSRTGFTAGAYFTGGKWAGFLKLEKYDSKSFVPLETADFDTLLAALVDAKVKIWTK